MILLLMTWLKLVDLSGMLYIQRSAPGFDAYVDTDRQTDGHIHIHTNATDLQRNYHKTTRHCTVPSISSNISKQRQKRKTRDNMTTTTQPPPPVLISGAGLASLLLAQALRAASVPFKIYERDASVSFRAQGYRLRLSLEGLDAIESVLEKEHWQRFWDACGKTGGGGSGGLGLVDAVTGGDISPPPAGGAGVGGGGAKTETKDNDKSESLSRSLQARDGVTVGISRGDMRRIFMQGLEEHIYWSHTVTGYEHVSAENDTNDNATAGIRAIFADGSKSPVGSMLIGGEGIYSKTAKQVSQGRLKVYDTGARGIHGQAPSTAFKGLDEGVWIIQDSSNAKGKVSLITNIRPGEMDNPDVQFGWTIMAGPGIVSPPGDDLAVIGRPAAESARALAKGWHDRVRPLVEQMADSEAAFWKITCSTPSGVPAWDNDERVTVIGDAVHSMTPAGGLGANTAMRDSALLGRMIADAGGWREGLTREYEDRMRVYGSEAVAVSYATAVKQAGIKIDEDSVLV